MFGFKANDIASQWSSCNAVCIEKTINEIKVIYISNLIIKSCAILLQLLLTGRNRFHFSYIQIHYHNPLSTFTISQCFQVLSQSNLHILKIVITSLPGQCLGVIIGTYKKVDGIWIKIILWVEYSRLGKTWTQLYLNSLNAFWHL